MGSASIHMTSVPSIEATCSGGFMETEALQAISWCWAPNRVGCPHWRFLGGKSSPTCLPSFARYSEHEQLLAVYVSCLPSLLSVSIEVPKIPAQTMNLAQQLLLSAPVTLFTTHRITSPRPPASLPHLCTPNYQCARRGPRCPPLVLTGQPASRPAWPGPVAQVTLPLARSPRHRILHEPQDQVVSIAALPRLLAGVAASCPSQQGVGSSLSLLLPLAAPPCPGEAER